MPIFSNPWNLELNFSFLVPYVVGFLVSVIAGHVVTKSIVEKMWAYIREAKDSTPETLKRYPGQQDIVGVVERSLYFAALCVNQYVFIGVWLTLKTISRSSRWENDTKGRKTKNPGTPGRAVFQSFLAGTGISLLFAAAGSAITFLLLKKEDNYLEITLSILSGLVLVWFLCWYFGESALIELRAGNQAKLERQRKAGRRKKRNNRRA